MKRAFIIIGIVILSAAASVAVYRSFHRDIASTADVRPADVVDASRSKSLDVEKALSEYPNFGKFIDFIDTEDTAWILVSSGIIKYDKVSGDARMYSIKDGFSGVIPRNMVLHNGSIWVATSRNITRFSIATGEFREYWSVFTNENDSWQAMFGRQSFDTIDGLSSDGNHRLYLDPYDGQLWTVSFNGVSRFDDEKDNWVSYGSSIGGKQISSTSDLAFSGDSVAVSTPKNKESATGGVFISVKGEYRWKNASDVPSYEIGDNFANLIGGEKTIFAIGRPQAYSSCADTKTSKASIILGYDGSVWSKDMVLNDEIAYGEEVYRAGYSEGKFTVYLRNPCGPRKDGRYFKYEIGEKKIVERGRIDNVVTAMSWDDGREDLAKEKEREFVPVLEKIFGQPAQKQVISVGQGKILAKVSSGLGDEPRYRQFDFDMRPDTGSDGFWERLTSLERPFLDRNGIEKDADMTPISCKGASSDSLLLRTHQEDYGMFGPRRNIIARFTGKELRVVQSIDYKSGKSNEDKILLFDDAFYCDDISYLVFSPERGVADYDLATGKAVFPDKENFRGTKQGYYGKRIVRGKVYFTASDGTIGSFDPSDAKYHYFSVSDSSISANSIVAKEEDERYIYFSGKDEGKGDMYVYDKGSRLWQTVHISKEYRGYISDIISFRDTVWILDKEGVYDGIWNVLKKGEWISERVGYADGQFTGYPYAGKGMRVVNDGNDVLVFSSDAGMWIYR